VLGVELGYARVSTAKQGPRPPVDALTTAGIPAKRIYLDKKSGATTDRPGLRVLLDYARPGADFTDASDDADRVLAVCDDVTVSHEGDGDLAVFDREAATFAAAVGSALADSSAACQPLGCCGSKPCRLPASCPSPRSADPAGVPHKAVRWSTRHAPTLDGRQLAQAAAAPAVGYVSFASLPLLLATTTAPPIKETPGDKLQPTPSR